MNCNFSAIKFSALNSYGLNSKKDLPSFKTKTGNGDCFVKTSVQSFTGLTKDISKTVYEDGRSIELLAARHSKSNGVVGTLPRSWIDKIPKENREKNIKRLYVDLKKVPDVLKNGDFLPSAEKKAGKTITKAFKRAGIISKNEKITLKKLGAGTSGVGYLIDGMDVKPGEDKFVLKVFYRYDPADRYNGKCIEINRSAYWKNRAGTNTQKPTLMFGDVQAGYMVTRFVDENTKRPKQIINPLLLGLVPMDYRGDNNIGYYDIDFGFYSNSGMVYAGNDKAVEINEALSKSKDAAYAYKQVYRAMSKDPQKEWDKQFEQVNFKQNPGRLAGLALALDFLENPGDSYMKVYNSAKKGNNPKDYYLIMKSLAEKIKYAPKENRVECFEKFFMMDPKIRQVLAINIHQLPKEFQQECKEMLDRQMMIFGYY